MNNKGTWEEYLALIKRQDMGTYKRAWSRFHDYKMPKDDLLIEAHIKRMLLCTDVSMTEKEKAKAWLRLHNCFITSLDKKEREEDTEVNVWHYRNAPEPRRPLLVAYVEDDKPVQYETCVYLEGWGLCKISEDKTNISTLPPADYWQYIDQNLPDDEQARGYD